ncbi:MAG: dihydroorotase [Bdellovibrionota bacterium]
MSTNFPDFAIQRGTCLLPDPQNPGRLTRSTTSIAVKDGKIVAIGDRAHEGAAEIFDASALTILPGVIDSQVHFREPGLTHKEDLETGTRGAVLGGVTSVFEMPNTKPSTTTHAQFEEKLARAKGRVWSDVAFFIGATPGNVDQLGTLELHPNCCAIKIFMGSSTGDLLIEEEENLRRILASGRRRVAIHAEDETRLRERKPIVEGKNDPRLHPVWRDEQTAILATTRAIRVARETKRPIHVLHVTTAEETELLKAAKDVATCEVTPQHLTLTAPECYERLGTLAQMNPPIREARHRDALWRAVNDGTFTVMGSDHAPHTREEKAAPYPSSPSGMTGVQTMLPIMLDHVNAGRLSLERLVELLCVNNARLYGARGKGEIRVGYDADFTIVDLSRERTIENKWIASRVGWTPFAGVKVKGWPIATVVRGHVVMRDDQLIGEAIGRPISFQN